MAPKNHIPQVGEAELPDEYSLSPGSSPPSRRAGPISKKARSPFSQMGSLLFSAEVFRGACGGPPVQNLARSGEVAPEKIGERYERPAPIGRRVAR